MLCKVVGDIVYIMFVRLFYLSFYYVCLGLIILEFFFFILHVSVFTNLHNYYLSLDSLTLKTHAYMYITVRIRINYHLTLKHSLLYKY